MKSLSRSWTEQLNTVKMSMVPNLSYNFNVILSKSQKAISVDINKLQHRS